MKIGLIADTHNEVDITQTAITIFKDRGIETILHAGDITSPAMLKFFYGFECYFVFGNGDLDEDNLNEEALKLGFHSISHIKEITIDFEKNSSNSPCMSCAITRRNELFRFAKDNKYEILALGHNLDDAVETTLMNMVFQGNISSMPNKLELFNGNLKIIRPLITLKESIIKEYATNIGFIPMKIACPNEKESKRNDIKNIISQMETLNPNAKETIFRSLNNIHSNYLPK